MWVLVILTVTLIYTECRTNIPMGIFPYNGMVSSINTNNCRFFICVVILSGHIRSTYWEKLLCNL